MTSAISISDQHAAHHGALRALRLSAHLFGRYAGRNAAIQQQHNVLVRAFAFLSSTVALREVSMTLAEIDLRAQLRFLRQTDAR